MINKSTSTQRIGLSTGASGFSLSTYFSLLLLIPSLGIVLSTMSVRAQTFPPPSSCTSKDLRLVSASLSSTTPCFTCTPGTTLIRGLNLAINNKTGSTRTSFAYWGILEIYNSDGTLASSSPISGCVGPVPKNATTTFANGNLTYLCGQSLRLVNLYLAWTDASPSSTCPTLLNNTSTINPKCGTLPSLFINAGVDGEITSTDATCTSDGSITVAPFGSVGPYSVRIGTTIFNNVTTSATFNNLPAGTYSIVITDANNCSVTRTRAIGPATNQPPAPVSGGDQVECANSPLQTLTASASTTTAGATISWFDAASGGNPVANPALSSIGSITFYAQSNLGTCISATRTPVTLTIEPRPANPISGGDQTECEQSPIQTLTAAATGSNIAWFTTPTGGSPVANPTLSSTGSITFYAEASIGSCTSAGRTAVTLTINPTPANPVSGGNQAQCAQSPVQTLAATATGSNIAWFSTASGGSPVASPTLNSVGSVTYYAEASIGTCKSFGRTAVLLTINANTTAPQICIVEPSLCGPATGSITFLSPIGAGTLYSINNGLSYQSSPFFLNLAAGSVNGIMVKDGNGCESPAIICIASDCGSTPQPAPENVKSEDQPIIESNSRVTNNSPKEIALNVYPNPFTDKVRFVADVPQEGNAVLEVFDMLGKKVNTVYSGKVVSGINTFEMNMPYQQYANYIYRLVVNDKQVTGKLIQSKP